jgi:hypothetical protein
MSTNKFLTLINGIRTYVTAIATSAGVGDANKIVATGSDGKLDPTLFPTGIGTDSEVILASEAILPGEFVNVYDAAGTRKVRKADASNGRVASGFSLTNIALNASGTIYFGGANNQRTGLTIDSTYFLSATTPGAVTTTPPSASGQIIQELGRSVATTTIEFQYQGYIAIQ